MARPDFDARLVSQDLIADQGIGNSSLLVFMQLRSAFVLSDASGSAAPTGIQFTNLGTATAFDTRGYLLTAAHVVPADRPTHRVFFPVSGTIADARVVWRGNPDRNEPDLAVLHVPLPLKQVFEWSSDVTEGTVAFGAGPNRMSPTNLELSISPFVGVVCDVSSNRRANPVWQEISSTAPALPGDSGGPFVDNDGMLVGIMTGAGAKLHFAMRWKFLEWQTSGAEAVRPDLQWLRSIVEVDADAHGGKLTFASQVNY